MKKEELKQKSLETIEADKDLIIQLGNDTYRTPELGYKEFKTTKAVADAFRGLGLEPETEIAYTGCKVERVGTGPRIAVMGELDCIVCAEHKDANEFGNVHACGHNAQLANMFGAAVGILKSGVAEYLDGSVEFIAIPAEECVDLAYRAKLMQQKEIKFLGGKQEYLSRGKLDKTDMILQCHMMEMQEGKRCILDMKCNGFMSKTVRFIGQSAHAGFAPENGINALNMAELAMNNIHALRETFRDEDKVRVSMIIKEGGSLVNVVPSLVTMEIMVRAFTIDAMIDAGKKVTRGLKAAALALGGQVEIHESIGYLPLATNCELSHIYRDNMIAYAGATEESFVEDMETAGSTDLGDISQMKPCMHIWAGGIKGGLHTKDYQLTDPYEAYVTPAKMMALSLIDLLYDDAKMAKDILARYIPAFTKEDYLRLMDEHSKVDIFDGAAYIAF